MFFPFSVSKTEDKNTGAKSSNTFNCHEITGCLRYLHCTEISYKDEIFFSFFVFVLATPLQSTGLTNFLNNWVTSWLFTHKARKIKWVFYSCINSVNFNLSLECKHTVLPHWSIAIRFCKVMTKRTAAFDWSELTLHQTWVLLESSSKPSSFLAGWLATCVSVILGCLVAVWWLCRSLNG